MTVISKIVCNNCDFDLTEVGNALCSRLELRAVPLQRGSGPRARSIDEAETRLLSGSPFHFCDTSCMGTWLSEEGH